MTSSESVPYESPFEVDSWMLLMDQDEMARRLSQDLTYLVAYMQMVTVVGQSLFRLYSQQGMILPPSGIVVLVKVNPTGNPELACARLGATDEDLVEPWALDQFMDTIQEHCADRVPRPTAPIAFACQAKISGGPTVPWRSPNEYLERFGVLD